MRPLLSAAILVTTSVSAAHGSVTYLTQTRQLSAQAGALTPVTAAAPDFGAFDSTVTQLDLPSLVGPCVASQISQLLPDRLLASGTSNPSDGNQGSGGTTRSLFDVTFSVDQPTPYHLTGSWMTDYSEFSLAPIPIAAFIRLPGIFESAFAVPSGSGFAHASFDTSGILAPGTYRLWIDFNLSYHYIASNAGQTHSSYSVTLEVPAPGAATLTLCTLAPAALLRRPRRTTRSQETSPIVPTVLPLP
jgi:hypothetical protein